MQDEKNRNLVFVLTILFSGMYLLWRTFFTLPWQEGTWQVVMGVILLSAEWVTMLGMFELMISRMRSREKKLEFPQILPGDFPDVDVLIATHNEPAKLLYKTINACMYLEYPDRRKVHVYVCDDGNREEIRALARNLGAEYLGLADNRHAKSGNYNHALTKTSSPLIATFDADMIPRRQFLLRTVPYFLLPEQAVGLIQTPQSFYNHDLFQFNLYAEADIPNEQDFFSREINIMRNASNAAAYTGSNTVISRKAMEEIGGFPYGTVTEDFETSIRLQKAGYLTYATEEVLAAGLSTTTVESMVNQRIRWARGVIQSIRNTNALFTGKLPPAARLAYANAFLYWWSFFNRLVFILSPVLFALFDFRMVECGFGELLIFWLPSHLLYSLAVRYLSTNVRSMRWSQIIDTILAPWLVWPVFLETLGIRQLEFKVTEKDRKQEGETPWKYFLPHGILLGLTVAAILRYSHRKYGSALIYSSVILFWLFYNLIALIYAFLFLLGRESRRKFERFLAEERVEIFCLGKQYEAVSRDVSEEGIAFFSQKDIPLDRGDRFQLTVHTDCYKAVLDGRLVHRRKEGEEFFYAAMVEPRGEQNKREWMQIIYDREHSLPKELDPWMTAYDDLSRNIHLRYRKHKKERKKDHGNH